MADSIEAGTECVNARLRRPQADRRGWALVLAILPIVLTEFPPSTDLPQHIAQVRLFLDTLRSPGGPYVIQGLAPNNLIYSFILIFWSVLPVAYVGPAVLVLIVFLWIAAIFLLAAGKGRPTEAAILASLLVFNQSFYWGFLNFMTGFPVFVLWFALTTKAPGTSLLEVLCRTRRDVLSALWKPRALAGGGRRLACPHRSAQENQGEGIPFEIGDPHPVRCRRASVVSPAVLGPGRLGLRCRSALVAALRPLVLVRGRGLRGDPGPRGDHGLRLPLRLVRTLRLAEQEAARGPHRQGHAGRGRLLPGDRHDRPRQVHEYDLFRLPMVPHRHDLLPVVFAGPFHPTTIGEDESP